MANEYAHKIYTRYLQKCLRYDIKHSKTRHFHVILGLHVIFRILFLTDFDASKSF